MHGFGFDGESIVIRLVQKLACMAAECTVHGVDDVGRVLGQDFVRLKGVLKKRKGTLVDFSRRSVSGCP